MNYSKQLRQFIDDFSTDELDVIQTILEHHSLVPKAPQVLKESIMEMTEVLSRAKGKSNDETLKKYQKWLDSMNMAFTFIMDISKIATENIMLKDLSETNYRLYKLTSSKLAKYEILEQLIISDNLEKDLEIVRKKIANGKRTN